MAQKKQGTEKKRGVKIQDLSPKKDAKGGGGRFSAVQGGNQAAGGGGQALGGGNQAAGGGNSAAGLNQEL